MTGFQTAINTKRKDNMCTQNKTSETYI